MNDLDAIKAATWPQHARAERSGIIADILAGKATRFGVAVLWRNLLPVYQALDATVFGLPALIRSAAIEADLLILAPGVDLPLLPQAAAYTDRVKDAALGDPGRLIAHAYVRYLGDLNGGLIMQRRLVTCLGELARRLTFHDYPRLQDTQEFARSYRAELDNALRGADFGTVAEEVARAFQLNIALSEAVSGVPEH
jgi:heme oxygenase